MSATRAYGTPYDERASSTISADIAEGSGWITFAAIMLGFGGVFGFIDGLVAVSKSYPFWSLCVFAIDLLVVYALAVYGGKQLREEGNA